MLLSLILFSLSISLSFLVGVRRYHTYICFGLIFVFWILCCGVSLNLVAHTPQISLLWSDWCVLRRSILWALCAFFFSILVFPPWLIWVFENSNGVGLVFGDLFCSFWYGIGIWNSSWLVRDVYWKSIRDARCCIIFGKGREFGFSFMITHFKIFLKLK